MRLITQRDNLANLAEFYRSKYQGADGGWAMVYFSPRGGREYVSSEITYRAIVACGVNPTPEQIAAIPLGESWYTIDCDECGKMVESAIEMGDGYDEYPLEKFCADCLPKAVALIKDR